MSAVSDDYRTLPIVCYAEDWGRLPSSTQHLMRELSKTHPILWVDSMGLRAPSAASAGDLKRIWNKIKKFSEGIEEVEPNIFRLSPLVLPLHKFSLVRRFNRRLMKVYVGGFLKKKRFDRFIQWSSTPTSAPMLGALSELANVYYLGDEFSEFTQFDKELVTRLERELLIRSDLLFVVSERLRQTKSKFNAVMELLPHGCDYAHFSTVSKLGEHDIPGDLAKIPHPRIGYYGLIRDWFDFPMLREIFQRHPEWSLVLIGPCDTDTSGISDLPNVHLLGPKPYTDLPKYLRGFDVGIIPYRDTEITRNANPLKLLEYLSSGIPVVTTDVPAVHAYSDGLRIAKDTVAFERGIVDALAETGIDQTETRQKIGRENSWRSRVELVETVFDRQVYPRTSTPSRPVVMHLIAAMDIAGAEKVVLNVAGHSKKSTGDNKYEHRVTSFVRMSDGRGSDFLRQADSAGVMTDRIPIYSGWDVGDIVKLRRIIKKHRVSILHTHGYKADIVGVIAAKLSGLPIVATAHGFSAGKDKLSRNEKIGRWFLRRADRVIAVSENVKATLIDAGVNEENLALLPNAIDFDYFAKPPAHGFRKEWNIASDGLVIGTAGRLAAEKAQGNLIRAVLLIPEALRNRVTVVIAGEGPEQERLLATAAEMRLTDRVKLIGFVRDVHSFYHALDLFCLPSLTEGHPLTIMEAAACGLPVVASRVGAIGQLIGGGVDGYTPEPGDIPQLAKAIERALSLPDRGKKMGQALRDKLHRDYDIGPWAARVNEIYVELLREKT
jgi:glycosyltransferase involved in cell wall biosynthesis